jgi:hypothetical protein
MRWIPALAAVALLAACGGSSGPQTFHQDGFDITFRIPDGFKKASDVTVAQQAGQASAQGGVLLDSHNGVFLLAYDLRKTIDASNVSDAKPELDQALSGLTGKAQSGKPVEFGGLPGYEYEIDVSTPTNGHSRLVFLFHGKHEDEINCQWTDKQDEVAKGCDTVLRTLKPA